MGKASTVATHLHISATVSNNNKMDPTYITSPPMFMHMPA